ncbi:MAG: hypothetical protein IJ261_04535, partial [Clostridia bacterium]|nr:hypothetical protein [Clostridia bacterium]
MKVGKKALSLLLAVIMIMSSVSVSFSVFAATTDTDEIFSAIETHYAGLKSAILAADPSLEEPDKTRVPDGEGKEWGVAMDTATSGWQAVVRAFVNYIQGTAGSNPTLVKVVDDIKADVAARVSTYNLLTAADYNAVLDYLLFGTEKSVDAFESKTTINLEIGCGFDLLAWDTVTDMDENRTYSTASVTIATKSGDNGGYVLDPDKTVYTSDVLEDPKDMVTTVGAVKTTLQECVLSTNFPYWFNKVEVQGQTLTDAELDAFAKLFNEFTDVVILSQSGYTPAEVWAHYVAEAVDKTYGETEAFYSAAGAAVKADQLATELYAQFKVLLADDASAMDAAGKLAHYNKYVAIMNELNASPYATPAKAAMNEKAKADGYDSFIGTADSTIEKEMSRLSIEIAKAYALLYADALKEYADKAEFAPKFDSANDKWQVYDEASKTWVDATEDDAAAWLYGPNGNDGALALVTNIGTYVLGYATYDDVATAITAAGNNINKEAYDK